MFSILDISDLTSPQPIDSISVSEAYELANVYDIGGYTVSSIEMYSIILHEKALICVDCESSPASSEC